MECPSCGNNEGVEDYCPYRSDVDGVDELCDCCPNCREQCAQDI